VEPDADVAGEAGAVKVRGLNATADGLNLNSLAAALRPFLVAGAGVLTAGGLVAAPVAGAASVAALGAASTAAAGVVAMAGAGATVGLLLLAAAALVASAVGVAAAVGAANTPADAPAAASAGTLLIAATSEELADVATLSEQVAAPEGARATDDIVDVTTDGDFVLEPASASASAPEAPPTDDEGAGGGGSVSTPTDVTDAASDPASTVMEVIEPASDATSSTTLPSALAGRSSLDTSDKCDGARAERPCRRSAGGR